MSETSGTVRTTRPGGRISDILKSLRGRLVLRTLVPIGLLVAALVVFGQLGYTQVSESLATARDRDLASVEAARLGDHLLQSVQSLRQVADSSFLPLGYPSQIYPLLLDESLLERFDLAQVSDATGKIMAASDRTSGGEVLSRASFEALKGSTLPMLITQAKLKDGRPAILIASRYTGRFGEFGGVVEGAIALGGQKLGLPLTAMSPYEPAAENSFANQAVSYLVAGDGTILWHPDPKQIGKATDIAPLVSGPVDAPGAIVTRTGGDQSVVGYAPLNLGRLVPRARIDSQWVQWNVVTQEKWSNIIAPLNSLWLGLLAIAFMLFLISLVLIVRTANTLTRPVATLVAAARSLSAGNLRQRLEISGPSEIEELSHQFNNMADRLAESYEDLEVRVATRTSELATANAYLERSLLESQTVQAVAANIAGTAGLDEILQQIASSTADAVGSEGAIVFLPVDGDKTRLCVAAVWNMPQVATGTVIPVDSSLSGLAFTSGKPQISEDAQNDFRLFKQASGAENIHSMLSVPLSSHGEITGALNAVNKRDGRFNDNDLRLLKLLADQTAVAIERAQLYTDTERQVHALRTINDLALSVTLSQSVEKTMTAGMERIGKLTGTSGSVVYLFDEKTHNLNLTASYGLSPRHFDMLKTVAPRIDVDEEPDITIAVLEAFRRQEPYKVEETGTESFMSGWWRSYEEITPDAVDHHDEITLGALIALPLSVRDKRLGTLTIYFAQPRKFDADEVQMYQSLAQILGLALYNTQLFAQSSKLATVEERARLARELHDSVTQSLFSLNLTLRAARRVLERDPSSAAALLDNVHELAQGSLAEMRALIFELRPQALENEGLASALQKHAEAVRARSGLKVHLKITGERRLPIAHEEALYQIAREALHNVVKHAQAGEAWIDLDLSGDDVLLSIRDNGRGFDLAALRQGGGSHIGTSTMQERAGAIAGHLELESAPGKGTKVSVRVHIPEAETPAGYTLTPAEGETESKISDESLEEKLTV